MASGLSSRRRLEEIWRHRIALAHSWGWIAAAKRVRRAVEEPQGMEPIDVQRLLSLQQHKTEEWHEAAFTISKTGLFALVEENHRCNFELWHEEDKARRDDRGYEYVYRAKRRIDRWNQRRNDVVEWIDEWIAAREPAPASGTPMNSETPGMIIDRLSILALKEYHMAQEAAHARRLACRDRTRNPRILYVLPV